MALALTFMEKQKWTVFIFYLLFLNSNNNNNGKDTKQKSQGIPQKSQGIQKLNRE